LAVGAPDGVFGEWGERLHFTAGTCPLYINVNARRVFSEVCTTRHDQDPLAIGRQVDTGYGTDGEEVFHC
jgi:hypothetical protein